MIYTKKLQWTDKLNQGTDQPTNHNATPIYPIQTMFGGDIKSLK